MKLFVKSTVAFLSMFCLACCAVGALQLNEIAATSRPELAFGGAFDGERYLIGLQLDGQSNVVQFVTAAGLPDGAQIPIPGALGMPPDVAYGSNVFLVAWPGEDGAIRGQLVTPAGTLQGSAFALSPEGSANVDLGTCRVAFGGGCFLVAWEDIRLPDGEPDPDPEEEDTDVFVQRVQPDGTLVGTNTLVSGSADGDDGNISIGFDGARFLVVYSSETRGSIYDREDVRGRFVSPSEGVVGSSFPIDENDIPSCNPTATVFANGQYVVLFHESVELENAESWKIYARFVSTNGVVTGDRILLAGSEEVAAQFPSLGWNGSHFLVALREGAPDQWEEGFPEGEAGEGMDMEEDFLDTNAVIRARWYDAAFQPVSAWLDVTEPFGDNEAVLSTVMMPAGTGFALGIQTFSTNWTPVNVYGAAVGAPSAPSSLFSSVTIWRSLGADGPALFEVDVSAPTGKTITVTVPTVPVTVYDVSEDEFAPGEYEYYDPSMMTDPISELEAHYPQGDYVLRIYSDAEKTTLEETLVVSFGTSEPLPFPEVYPALTQPVPAGGQLLLAGPVQTYTWPSYSGTAGTATHMTLEITGTDEADEYFAEYDAAINGSASYTPPTVPLGEYDLELAFFFRQNTQTPGGTLVECANERYSRYALTVTNLLYQLSVNNGSGSGAYTNGSIVAVTADAPPSGQVFDRWTGATQYVANVFAAATTVTMPPQGIALTAIYLGQAESLFSSVTIWRSLGADGPALFEVDVSAPTGKTITVTVPTVPVTVYDVSEDEFAPGEYEYYDPSMMTDPISELEAQYPQGDYVLRIYSDAEMTNLEETLVVSFGTSEPLPFPEVYPALTQPVPAGDQLLAEPEQTYTWPSYSGTAGTATHMTLEITATDEEDEYFAEYDAAINGSASFTPPTVPLGQYDLELAFFFRQNTQTPGGTLVECANERYARYALSIQDPPLTEFMYVTNNTMITITGYTGEGSDVIIPELIDGLPVTGIADYAFAWNNSLTNVLIPASITYIGNNVFNYCPYLDAIEVAEGNLFYSSLDGVLFDAEFTTLLRYPEGRVGDYAVPEGVEHIADRAFYYCLNNLTGVTLPPSVISIGGEAFSMCYGLAVAELSTNVVSIGQSAFSQCNSLGEIILPNSVTNLGDSAFLYCSSLTNVVLPEGLATIGFQVFHSCSSLEQIEIPASVTSISQGAFAWCGSLLGMELPEGLTSIGNSAFSYCGSLTNIAIPYGVTSIGDYAFHWCPGLSGMIIPGSVSSIGYAAFAQCGGLSSLILSNGVVSIGESAFASCVNLTNIMIPASVTSIGQWAFSQCAQLASIEVAGANTNYSSQDGVLFNKDQTQLLLCPEGKTGGYAIPSGVETIQNNAFQYCTHVTDISIPDSVTVLGPAAFAGCSSLTNVLIGSGISQIEDSVFSSCTSMGSLLIPANVTLIGNGAFYGCSTLTNVVIAGNVSHLGYMAFYGCSQLATLVLPASLESLGDYAFGYCSALESLYFWGNVPGFVGVEPFYYASETLTVYYLAGATGWGPTFADRPAALWLFELSATKGPYSGGNSITISNGSFGTVTNVLVGGVAATITASGNNWVTVTVSACGSPGVKDIVLQTSEHGDITLTGVYTVNPAGVIGVDQRAAVAAGGYHALSLKSDNSIVAWGRDIEGQTTVPSPNIDFSGVAGGYYHSLGRKSDGSIVAWGLNANGQATVPSPNVDFVAVAAGTYHSLGVKSDSSIVAWGRNSDGQTIVPSPNANFVAVAGGYGHSLGLKSDGRIVAWGSNSNGQTNVPSPNTGFVSVAAGFYHSLGLKSDGSIVAWGANGNGQTTVSSPNADFVAVAGGVYHSVGLKADGSVVAWGENSYGQTNVPSPNTDFVAVAAGYAYSLGLKSDGRIVVWGYNSNGQTNVPPPNSSFGFPAGVQPSSGLRTGGYDVVISGTNLGNGSDITEVTLCGVPAAIVSQSSTQVVVTAGAGTPGNGDVVVSSTSYGVTTKTDGFTYLKTDQTINFPAISDKLTTDAVVLSATALSGLPVSFSLASGPAVINNGTNLAFTGAGTVSIVASQPGDANWNAAPNVTNTFEVTQPVIEYQLTVSNGTGSGAYTNGAVVAIAADEPAFGKMFDCWTGDTQSVASVTSASTTVTMPDGPVTVTATYKLIPVEPAYSDGFEASQLNPFWVPSLQNGTITPSSDRAHTGSQSAKFSAPGGGQKWLYLRHFFDRPQYGTVSVWVYDSMQYIYFGMQVQNSALGSWGAGIYNWDWDYGTFYYTSSMSDGSAVKSAVGRFAGWRKFTIRSLKNELVLDVDGQEMYRGPGVAPFDRIQLHLSGPGSGTIYFDDFSFTPEIEGRVETPTFEPLPGTVFTNQAVVALACATTGASIRYTTDGSEPTEASALYETGLLLTKTTPLKARAFKASYYPSETASAMFTRAYTLADAVDCRDLLFRTGGEAPWFIQSAVVGEGTDAAQSGAIGHRQSSWMETSVEGPGILSFRWKLSCEDDELLDDWDYVAVIVNGVEVARRDGITEWELVQVPLEAGVNTVRWVYTKDRVVSEGMDCAWVDGVSWTPASQETQTTPVPVPHLWLDLYTLVLNGDYETAAFSDDDGDGHEAWEEFVAGTYPDDPESVLRVHIHFENGLPVVTWDPDLGESRTYVVEGRSSLSEGEWEPASEGHRFFRVKVDLP